MLSALMAIILLVSFPLFALMQKVEQKDQEKSKCPAAFFRPTHRVTNFIL